MLNRFTGKSRIMDSKPPQPPSHTLLGRLIDLDTAISLHLYTLFHPILPFSVLKFLEFSGDGRLFFPIILSLLFTTTSISALTTTATLTTTSLLILNLLLGSLLDLLLIGLLKHVIQRPRPVYNKNMFLSFAVDHWSFPSGHSSRVSFIATLINFYSASMEQILVTRLNFDANSMLVEYFVAIVGVWAAITSASRVLLGRHFVLDVVTGACVGVLEGIIVIRFFNYEYLKSFLG